MAALAAAVVGWAIRHFGGHHSPIPLAVFVLVPYGVIYFAATHLLGVAEAGGLYARALGIVRRK